MVWILLDVALVLLGLGLLGAAALRLYRAVRALLRRLGEAADRVGDAAAALDAEPAPRPDPVPTPAGHVPGRR